MIVGGEKNWPIADTVTKIGNPLGKEDVNFEERGLWNHFVRTVFCANTEYSMLS